MADNIHPVVELLAARMESHPEEFQFQANSSLAVTGRWAIWISQLGWHFNEAEKELIYGKAKELIFQRVHEEVLDELLNGEERRAEAEREREEIIRRGAQQQYASQLQQATLASQLPGTYLQGADLYNNQIAPTTLRLGNETIDEGLINSIKRKLGL